MVKLEKVEQLALQIGGEIARQIVLFLIKNGENISEFVIAENLKVEINVIRKTLYMLQENNLVHSMRKKDKKKGWYIYYWTFDENQAKIMIERLKKERINSLKKRLELESETTYYTCSKKCIRMTFEHALENNFTCPVCDKVLKEIDNKKQINLIKKELELLESPDDILESGENAEAAAA